MKKECAECGSVIYITGSYQRASRRKYCDSCREKINRERSRVWQQMNRRDKRELHQKTKIQLARANEIIFDQDEEIKLLKIKIERLEREIESRGGDAYGEAKNPRVERRRRKWPWRI